MYYDNNNNNNYRSNNYYKPKQDNNSVFLFLVAQGNYFVMRALSVSGHTLNSAIPVYRNMFPQDVPLGVFKVSLLEAHLLSNNFRTHNITLNNFANYYQQQQQLVVHANNSGNTSVYIDNENEQFRATVNKTANFFGFIVNQKYIEILNYMFYATNTAISSITGANAGIPTTNVGYPSTNRTGIAATEIRGY